MTTFKGLVVLLLLQSPLLAVTIPSSTPGFEKNSRLIDQDYETVELTHPVKVQKIPSLMAYESVMKIVFAVDFTTDLMQKLYPRLKEEFENQSIKDIQEEAIDPTRENRSVKNLHEEAVETLQEHRWVPINSVVSKPSGKLFGTEHLIESYAKILEKAEISGLSLKRLSTSEYENHLKRTSADKISLEGDMPSGTSEDHLTPYEEFVLNDLKDVLYTSCIYRLLPADMVATDLQKMLREMLLGDSLPINYRFVISPDNFDFYLNQSIADCMFTAQRVYVVVNVPLVREETRWQFFRTYNPRFIFDQKICYIPNSVDNLTGLSPESLLQPSQEAYFGFERNHRRTVAIGLPQSNPTCRINGINQLCYVGSSHLVPPIRDFDCATAILDKLPVRDLKGRCEFRCIKPEPHQQQIYIDRRSDTVVQVTNVRKVRIQCPRSNFTRNFERIGSLKILLPECDCYVSADDEIFAMACGSNGKDLEEVETSNIDDTSTQSKSNTPAAAVQEETNKTNIRASYLIPVTWTKNNQYNMLVEGSLSFKIKNHKEIIDFEWQKPAPVHSRSKWGSSFIGGLFDYVE